MAHIKTAFPHPIRVIEHSWIPLADGTRLAARIWLPEDAEQHPMPAILEYLPYRKNDGTARRDALRMPYFAGHGYAAVRVDMRGSGDSDGILYDEYLPQEQADALEVLVWIAAQPWCTGAIGMMGISWGGFNSLQIAAHRPPQLKAIITHCSTDDRYADDVHYVGGCLLASEMLNWASIMLAYNGRPPDPQVVGERWRAMWLERLAETPFYVEEWLSHQRRDAFWRQGSVCEDFSAITCAVYAVGGWADGYTNAVPRLLAGLTCPRKGLIGPWAHLWPDQGIPGPPIGFLQECLRWWDYWLKDQPTGIMDEPMLRSWIQASAPPQTFYHERQGFWVADPVWPSPHVTPQTFILAPGLLHPRTGDSAATALPPEAACTLLGSQIHGLAGGVWCGYGAPGDQPGDQRGDDARALCFDAPPQEEALTILGYPEVTLTVAVDQPVTLLAVRLCDVAPTGESQLVSWGVLNLTHRDSHAEPTPLEPGQRYTVTIRLNAVGHRIAAGHHWRVAVAPTLWPHVWPAPAPVTLTLFTGAASRLSLPVRPPQADDAALPPFAPAETAPPPAVTPLRLPTRQRTVSYDTAHEPARYTLTDTNDGGAVRFADGLEYGTAYRDVYAIVEGDPLSAEVRAERTVWVGRGAWQTRIETHSCLTSDASTFRVDNTLRAYETNVCVFSTSRTFTVVRDGV
jgi:hypothetical protein